MARRRRTHERRHGEVLLGSRASSARRACCRPGRRAACEAGRGVTGGCVTAPVHRWAWSRWRQVHPGLGGSVLHRVLDERVMAGNGVIGLGVAERLDDIDAVLVPWGGGGLTVGTASRSPQSRPARRSSRVSPRPGRRLPPHSPRAGRRRSTTSLVVDGAGSKALLRRHVPERAHRSSRGQWRYRWGRPPRRYGSSPREVASSPRAPARWRWPPRSRATVAPVGSWCIVSEATFDPVSSRPSFRVICPSPTRCRRRARRRAGASRPRARGRPRSKGAESGRASDTTRNAAAEQRSSAAPRSGVDDGIDDEVDAAVIAIASSVMPASVEQGPPGAQHPLLVPLAPAQRW